MVLLLGTLLLATVVAATGAEPAPNTRRICVNGDPHYTTFDGAYYDYQSNCPYLLSAPCNGRLDNGYSDFSVKAKNEFQDSYQDGVSYIGSTQVVFYNKTIFVNQYMDVFVDDVKVYVPYYYPSKWETQFSIALRNGDIVIKNDQIVEVDFHYGQLCLSIPDVPEFRGSNTLCGLAGNFDGNCKNDLMKPDGTVMSTSCRPSQAQTDAFADSWITFDDYTHPNPQAACIDGSVMTNKGHTCEEFEGAAADCMDIFNAQDGTGPFAACQVLGQDAIQEAYDSCIYDVCLKNELRCTSFADFAQSCQLAIGGKALADWRTTTGCEMDCPAHSSYTNCVSTCAQTCAGPASDDECAQPCTDGCSCDSGYVSCIPLDQCGCVDANGNMHATTQRWLSDDCSTENYCQNRMVISKPFSCPAHTHCGVSDNELACVPGDPVTTPSQPTRAPATVAPVSATDNYCKCGIVNDWFEDDWNPANIWVDVVIILDTSMSMGESLEEAKSLITSFIGLMSTDTTAEFYSRIGVVAVSDTVEVIYNLNMSSSDDLDSVQQHKIDKIDVGAAFHAALKMFADGAKMSSYRENAQQIIYYLTNSAPGANMNGVDDFKTGGGIIVVNDFILEGEVADAGLQKLASDNYFFTDLSDNYINSLAVFCEANCFCAPDAHPFNDDENSPRTRANRGCFHPVNNGIPQQKARETCQKEFGALVSIHDSEKEFFVNSVVSIFGPKKKFWLGLQFDGANWNWEDKSTDPFTDWDVKNGQPNTENGKLQCAYAQQGTGFNTPWTAANCAMGGIIYVCEAPPCSMGYKKCL